MKAEIFLGLNKGDKYLVSKNVKSSNIEYSTKGLYKAVCEHFGLADIKEVGLGRKLFKQREIYAMLTFTLFDIPEGKKSSFFRGIGDLIGRDRSSIIHLYDGAFKDGFFKSNPTLINGQRYMWHFYSILSQFKKEDHTSTLDDLYIKDVDKGDNSLISNSLRFERKAILNFISMGYSYKEVNEAFFFYTQTFSFMNAIKKYRPALKRLMDYHIRKINS